MTQESEQNGKTSKVLPPYLNLTKFARLVDVLSTRNFQEVKPSDLNNYQITGTDAYVAIGALKFLGVLDENGKAAANMRQLQVKGDARTKAFKDIVTKSYSKLFETVTEPYSLSADDLNNDFLTVYEISPRIARTAVPLFLWLGEQAGLREATTKVRPISNKKEKTGGGSKKEPKSTAALGSRTTPPAPIALDGLTLPFAGSIKLSLPLSETVTHSLTSPEYKEISDAINKYAAKFLIPETSNTDESEE